MSTELATTIGVVLILVDWAIRITAPIIVPRGRKPTAAMAWLLAIFLIPFVGILFFLLLLVRGASFVSPMRDVEQGYRDVGRQLTLEGWNREPGSATFLDGVARLTSALQ